MVEETTGRPLVTAPPSPSGPTELGDRTQTGDGSGVTASRPVTSGPTRRLVMVGALAGESGRAMSRRLGLTLKTVQEHLGRLLSDRALERVGGIYRAGEAYAFEVARTAGDGSDRYPPRNATAGGVGVMTDGKRTFTVLSPPAKHPLDMPGFAGTSLTGRGRPEVKRQNHRFKFNEGGRTHDLLLTNQPTTGAWGLQYLRCSPPPKRADLGDAEKEVLWDRFTAAAVGKWAAAAGVRFDPAPRRSRPVSIAYQGVAPEGVKFRSAATDVDDTPTERTVETRHEPLADFLEAAPDWKAAVNDELAALEQRYSALAEREARIVRVAAKAADMIEQGQAVHLALLRAVAPPTAPQPHPLSSTVGVEFQ